MVLAGEIETVPFPAASRTIVWLVPPDWYVTVAFEVPVKVKVAFDPEQIVALPEMEAVGFATTVITCVCVQDPEFIKVMVVVPVDTAVTTPLAETVATEALEDTHGVEACAVPEPVKVVVVPTHKVVTGAAIVGVGLTTKVVVELQGTPATVAVTV